MISVVLLILILIFYAAWKMIRILYLAAKIPNSSFKLTLRDIFRPIDDEKIYLLLCKVDDDGLKKVQIGPVTFVNVNLPEDVKIVMNAKECLDKPYFLKFIRLYYGSLFGYLDQWYSHRKIISSFFTPQSIRTFLPNFNDKSRKLVETLKMNEGKGDFNVFPIVAATLLETFLANVDFDIDLIDKERELNKSIVENLKKFASIACIRMFKFHLHPEFIYKFTNLYKRECEARSKGTIILVPEVIKNARKKIKNCSDSDKSKNVIYNLMDPKNNLSDREIFDEILSLLMAVQDTSSIVISWTLLYLGLYKDIQDKVVSELRQVFGSNIDDISHDQVNQLEYLEMVINEIMRIRPAAPFVFRKFADEVKTSEGYTIPKYSFAFISAMKIHLNPKYWGDDASQFKPERFSKENLAKIHPYAFLPFTKGPRICIGWRYSMISMKIMIAHFLMHYEIDSNMNLDEINYQYGIVVNIKQGHLISIKKRCE